MNTQKPDSKSDSQTRQAWDFEIQNVKELCLFQEIEKDRIQVKHKQMRKNKLELKNMIKIEQLVDRFYRT